MLLLTPLNRPILVADIGTTNVEKALEGGNNVGGVEKEAEKDLKIIEDDLVLFEKELAKDVVSFEKEIIKDVEAVEKEIVKDVEAVEKEIVKDVVSAVSICHISYTITFVLILICIFCPNVIGGSGRGDCRSGAGACLRCEEDFRWQISS